MKNSDTAIKKKIADAAVDLYTYDRESFTLRNIAENVGLSIVEVQRFYPGKMAVLRGFYDLIPQLHNESAVEIPEYHSMNYGEKVANYVYTTFDLLSEQRDFVEATFEKMVLSRSDTGWHKESEALFKSLLRDDPVIPDANRLMMRDFVFGIMTREYMQLVAFWLRDDSEGAEKTIALTDKITALGNEILYSGVIEKGVDLIRYMVGQQTWKQRFPEISSLFDPGSWRARGCSPNDVWSGFSSCFGVVTPSNGSATVDIPIEDATEANTHEARDTRGASQNPEARRKSTSIGEKASPESEQASKPSAKGKSTIKPSDVDNSSAKKGDK